MDIISNTVKDEHIRFVGLAIFEIDTMVFTKRIQQRTASFKARLSQ